MKEPKVAIYIRLSLADEDTRRSKEESDSVQHQRLLTIMETLFLEIHM